jgi:hypothetical protein
MGAMCRNVMSQTDTTDVLDELRQTDIIGPADTVIATFTLDTPQQTIAIFHAEACLCTPQIRRIEQSDRFDLESVHPEGGSVSVHLAVKDGEEA